MQCTLAKTYEEGKHSIRDWLASEKLDGVRAIWTGEELLSRTLKPINAPEWFINQLPQGIILDGELFIDRGMFQTVVGVVRKKIPIDVEWDAVKYCVFDTPSIIGNYHERYNQLTTLANNIIKPVPYTQIRSPEHMMELYNVMVCEGAEGLMLRNPDTPYEYKRTANLLKVKPERTEEAIVIGHLDGQGKHEGRLGACQCVWNGVSFDVGTGFTDAERENPPEIGDMITFRFQELTNDGVPRFPVFVCVRNYE